MGNNGNCTKLCNYLYNHYIIHKKDMSNKVNPILTVLSVIIPIVGYVLYFVKKEDNNEIASNYLWAAIAGSIVAIVMGSCL